MKEKVENKYKILIQSYTNDATDLFKLSLTKSLGAKISQFILESAKSCRWELLECSANSVRLVLLIRSLLHPFSQLAKWYYYLRAKFRRFFIKPHGSFIVLIGPDGAGKSTTAEGLINSEFAKKYFQKKNYFYGHFAYLPELKKIVGLFKKSKNNEVVVDNNPNSIKPFGRFRTMIYPLYYGLDYFLGHFFIWKEKARAGLIVFDRYFYDYYLQRQFENCPRWILNIILKFLPEPDLLIYLESRPDVIYKRKPELTMGEIKRQSDICEYLISRQKNTIIVNTEKGIDEAINSIFRKVISIRIKY